VTICIENVWNNFTYKLDDFVRYIDEFESPLVQAYFDVGNHVIRSDWATPQDWVRKLGKRIRKIHLKDYHIEKKQWAMLLEGSVNWPEVMKALVEVGYVGWLTCELGGGDAKYLTDVSQRVDKIIGSA
jgi:hexulose-6-phosphate isomerase